MKRLAAIGMMACAVTTLAMPTKVELTKAQPIVNELMKPLVDDFKAKRKSAKEVAESAESFAKEAETEAAKLLLRDTDMTVSETALRLAFSDGHYFSNLFFERTGVRPRDYRRVVRG